MKKQLFLVLTALTLALLCACAPKAPAAPPEEESAVSNAQEGLPEETVSMEAVPVKTGVQTENGAYFYYAADGTRVEAAGMQTLDGKQYYLNQDHSLHRFTKGVNDCEGTVYIHAGEDGFAFLPQAAGFFELDGALYEICEDGSALQNAADGYLSFGPDGRYTSGNETLDAEIEALLDTACSSDTSRAERLREVYDYIRDNFRYLSMQHYDAGTSDWAEEAALAFLEQGKGNCYCFAGLFMYCARRLGYQAYVVAGWESNPNNDHAWTMIEQDGTALLYDVQLEYAYLYMFGRDPVDMFGADGADGVYRGFRYYFP